jgi:predicted permease
MTGVAWRSSWQGLLAPREATQTGRRRGGSSCLLSRPGGRNRSCITHKTHASAVPLPVDPSTAASALITASTTTAATSVVSTAIPATSTAVSTIATLKTFILSSIDPVVFLATASASLKLLIICCAVKYLSDTKKIPANTSVVLAQISFQLLIPCMLFVKVVQILAMQTLDSRLLLGMAAAAVLQIAIGSVWGLLLAPLVDEDDRRIFDAFPFNKRRRASHAVAEATSRAIGVAATKTALLPKPERASKGFKSLVAAASAFQNSFTLPAVFLLSLLPGAVADRAVAYLGLYLLAWSPCLWSFGLYTIQKGYRDDSGEGAQKFSIKDMMKNTLNPPVVAVFFAAALGLTPIGKALFGLEAGTRMPALPFELSIIYYGFQNVYDVVQMLGEGTLPIQTLVLAASLLDSSGRATGDERTPSSAAQQGIIKSIIGFFRGDSVVEARALTILATIRFILMPTSAILLYQACSRIPLFAPVLGDPILMFVLAVQAVMPSAQNLLIALQLSPHTQGAAGGLARLLLKLYALAILPVTLWVTGFASRLAVPLV